MPAEKMTHREGIGSFGIFVFFAAFIFSFFLFSPKAEAVACPYFGTDDGNGHCMGFLTTADGSPWSVPADWTTSNTVVTIGAGASGGNGPSGGGSGGGGGGAYASTTDITGLTAGVSTVVFQVGTGGTAPNNNASGNDGGDTFFNQTSGAATTCDTGNMTVCAQGGKGGAVASGDAAGGAGGLGSASIGGNAYDGGTGGHGNGGGDSGGGGGGAGGLQGAGKNGGNGHTTSTAGGGGGGGGAGGGQSTQGVDSTTTTNGGGAGGTGPTGTAGGTCCTSGNGGPGSNGSGGSGSDTGNFGGQGGDGTEFDSTHGSGGGGGGGSNADGGGAGGAYGGGGGGGENSGGVGGDGLIVIIYTPNNVPSISISQPDGVSDTVTVGDTYNITYTLSDSDNTVTAAFYFDTDNTSLNGTAISGACATAAEGTDVTCSWDTTGMTPGSYYVYGLVSDGTAPEQSAYSSGQITINSNVSVPTVTTDSAHTFTPDTASMFGNLTATGGETGAGTDYGFVYSKDSSFTDGTEATTSLGTYSGTGTFNTDVSGLSPDNTYYYRAYASNSAGVGYGSTLNFTTGDNSIVRTMHLFEGFIIKLISGKIILY